MSATARAVMVETDSMCVEPSPSVFPSLSPPICTFVSSNTMAPATPHKPRHAKQRSSSTTKDLPDFSKNKSTTRESEAGPKYRRVLKTRMDAAGAPAAVHHAVSAPPSYTSSITLHARVATADSFPSLSTPTTSPSSPATSANGSHGTNFPLLISGVLVGVALLSISAAILVVLFNRRARKLMESGPRFSMLKLGGTAATKPDALSIMSSFGNFVLISNSEKEVSAITSGTKRGSGSIASFKQKRELRVVNNAPDIHRYSSCDVLQSAPLHPPRDWGLPTLTTSISAPASPLLSAKDFSLHVQRQKAAELEQMVRMKFVREELPASRASCPELSSPALEVAKRASVAHGLDIVHASEHEVDIASTALCALDRYSVSFDPSSPTVPISQLFQVDKEGKVVRLASPLPSPSTPASDTMPLTPQSADVDTASLAEDDDIEDVDDAVIVRAGRVKSVEVHRGILVSVSTHTVLSPPSPPKPSRAASSYFSRPKSTSVLPAAPSLSPIVPSPTSLSADIEEVLEERVFAYRERGPWSKENYKLTTPGQVRALTEALALARPVEVQQQQQPWPWPAHRSAFGDLDDE